ncbi:hypothetical protein Corgl_1642 [Coriobacterium glomerans PW2]|uniref:BD-FAE-like domain-containing protein n=1 Tax=Coriobacterium glomerans (strain ATCC 49209 / DSM 20642 / JCM 10262 / PW2) TaxID=700015 RepID=F2N965_CORGP|nr:alpha/beta hydrolase [Coriobacterium glomerans]AEB07741.1 hypothetical protein Corgl_1642 [Coriobacterium glomerans PW2]
MSCFRDAIEVAVRMRASGEIVRTEIGMSVHRPSSDPARARRADVDGSGSPDMDTSGSGVAIIYLHGGGLLFGSRDDLPQAYIDQILARGHALICLDYPLAPQTAAPDIISSTACAVDELVRERLAALGCTEHVLFGRSAGAYLALMLAARAQRHRPGAASERDPECWPGPLAVWDFYGYTDLLAAFTCKPNPYYAAMPAVDDESAARIAAHRADEPLTCAPMEKRFSLYVYARQSGRWPEMVGADRRYADRLGLAETDIARLPPLFIAASTTDRDVPFEVSKHLSRAAPHTELHTVYYLEHDFDRDPEQSAGPRAYRAALDFLDTCRSAARRKPRDG